MIRNKFTDLSKKDSGNGGYGKLVPHIDKPRMSMQSFPYRNSLTDPGLSSDDDEPIIDDLETLDRFVSKINLATVASDPTAWRSRSAAQRRAPSPAIAGAPVLSVAARKHTHS